MRSRNVTSIIAGSPVAGPPGARFASTNPARTSEVVADVSPGDASTFAAAAQAARQARGEETEDILGRSLLATAVFCGLLVLFYAAAGTGLVSTTFGPDFAEGGRVLAPYALAVGLFSIANVLVGYHLSRGETRYAWIVAAGVVVQVAVLASLPTSLRGVVWTNVGIGTALLVVHEVTVKSSFPALRWKPCIRPRPS